MERRDGCKMKLSENEALHTYRIKMAKEGRSDKRMTAY
jgi:hypothetical protein